jgi:hypothetical protein
MQKLNTAQEHVVESGPVPELGQYITERYGRSKTVYLVKVKGDEVHLKEAEDRVDSFTISLTKFSKLYKKVA